MAAIELGLRYRDVRRASTLNRWISRNRSTQAFNNTLAKLGFSTWQQYRDALLPYTGEKSRDYQPCFNLQHDVYLPIIFGREPGARFSVAGASPAGVAEVVPLGAEAPPYSWNALPNPNSPIQMIRSCTYYRVGNRPVIENEFHNWTVGKMCWDPTEIEVAKIVRDSSCAPYATCLRVAQAEFEQMIADHYPASRDWIWLIGNETDSQYQDALVEGVFLHPSFGTGFQAGPTAYATFYAQMYTIIANQLNQLGSDLQPKLVFCQATLVFIAGA